MNKYFLAGLVAILVLAGGGLYLSNHSSPLSGSIAPSYVVAGDPNYAVALGSATQNTFTLGSILSSTSTVTSTVSVLRGLSYGLKLGDTCGVQLSSATSTNGYSADAQITAIAAKNATATVTFFNGNSTTTTVSTGTLTVVCQHY